MKKSKRTLLWQLEGEELKTPCFVFGTMHVRDRLAFGALPQLYGCIDQCAALATEFQLDELQAANQSIHLLPSQYSGLTSLYPPRVYTKLREKVLKYFDLDLDLFRHFPPFFVLNFINEQLLSKDMPVSLDQQLSNYARSQDKPCLGVETFAEQMALLNKIPYKYQAKALRSLVKNIHKHRVQLLKLGGLYATGDPVRIYQTTRRGSGALRKSLIFDRNRIMAERIGQMCRSQSIFVAIGAGHLAGAKGVLRLLKHQGLRLRPIPLSSDSKP